MVSDALLVDRAIAAQPPPEQEVRAWATEQRVFISSVMSSLQAERRAVAEAIQQFGAVPVWFEGFGGRDDDPETAYLAEVASSDIYVGILGRRYGRPLAPARYSATHAEYLEAERQGLRIAVWVATDEDREGHQQAFADEVQQFHVTGPYTTPEDLAADVTKRLRTVASEELAPWCKLGQAVFRAVEIQDADSSIKITARVRDGSVAAALEAMRPGAWAGRADRRLTWAGRSRSVRVLEIATTITTARSSSVYLELEPLGDRSPTTLAAGYSEGGGRTYSPEDLTELGLRRVLFDEPLPFQHAFMAEVPDPIQPLRALRLSDEILRPIAHLLLTETLVGGGRATRITRFHLGPPINRQRRFLVAWEPPRRYQNVPVEQRTIDGRITL